MTVEGDQALAGVQAQSLTPVFLSVEDATSVKVYLLTG
jgi:hypothetical protein